MNSNITNIVTFTIIIYANLNDDDLEQTQCTLPYNVRNIYLYL